VGAPVLYNPGMTWTPLETDDGSFTLVNAELNEACHSRAGAWTEACERYAAECKLAERAREMSTVSLLDVGTGLGLNLAAALAALEGTDARLDAVSLEIDPDVIARALELQHVAPHAPECYAEIAAVLRRALDDPHAARAGLEFGRGHRLVLCIGDGRETLPALDESYVFDAVFLDPFSPGKDPALWAPEFLGEVARRLAQGGRLSTYSASLAVRAGLASAGLEVGPGAHLGHKAAGTLAARGIPLTPFDPRTTRKLARRVARAAEGE
jgi:tRNA U34 5-methylaminomethyl-2-thiouridine-forming methyltransferase MnmC